MFSRIIFLAAILVVTPLARAGDLQFTKHTISEKLDYSAAALIDVNKDGKLDIVSGGEWFESPNWQKYKAADVRRIGGRPDGFSHLPFDVNRDGWMDVITVNYRSRSIKWMENPGESDGRWELHTVVEPGPMETGRLVDIDGDGQLDLLPNGRNFAAWWEFRWKDKTKKGVPAWIRHELPKDAKGHGVGFGDIDGDGRNDIVGQSGWLQAPADARAGRWRWHPEFKIERGSVPMLVVDPDEDGDNDIVWCSAHGFGIYWLENSTNKDGKRVWHRHAIDTSWSQCHAPLWADLDGDGRAELVTGKRYMAHGGSDPGAYDPLVAYRYQFNLKTKTWDRWTVTSGDRVGFGLDPKVGDLDNDGDLDLLACGRSGLYWLENRGPGTTPPQTEVSTPKKLSDFKSSEQWGRRRSQISQSITKAHGGLPTCSERVALDVRHGVPSLIRYNIEAGREATAQLLIPKSAKPGTLSAVVCMFEPGSAELANETTKRLASLGYACIVPDMATSDDEDPIRDGVWQAMRAADVLQSTSEVHGERIGFIGDAMSGKLGLYIAAIDQRFVATSAMTRSTSSLETPTGYSVEELIACAAPRAVQLATPSPTAWNGAAKQSFAIYALRKAKGRLEIMTSKFDNEDAIGWMQKHLPTMK